MARVFVSHASEDRETTEEVYRWLVAEGHEVFLDRDLRNGIVVGEEWEQRLNERLRWADAVVCVVTSAFLASKWCPYEVGYARSRGSRLLPVLAESGVDHPLVKSTQYADLTKNPTAGRAALVEALRRIDAAGGLGWADDRSLFPGLRPFEVEDHRVFFGRSGEVEQLAGLLRSPVEHAERTVLLVVGPSGCGKSSLVRAGLLHVMAQEPGWCTLPPILPGADPVAALARQLTAAAEQFNLAWTVAQVRSHLDDGDLTGLADELLRISRARRLLMVVDQFEELLTQAPPDQRARFAQLLQPALGGPVRVVATLRPEFLDQLLVDADLAVLPTRTFTLRPLHREALRTVIEGPARRAEIDVDDDLVTSLVSDTDSGEALPLLAFTLAQLAEGVSRGGRLSGARYDQLGGVQGALTRQADAALTAATAVTGRCREEVIAGLLRLVTVDEQGRPTRWRVSRDELPESVVRELNVFVERRLVTTDTDDGNVVFGVAHETFLSVWSPLAQAIADNVSALRARRGVEQAAIEWDENERPSTRLWERGQLAAAVADIGAHIKAHDLITDRVDLSPTARTFLRKSIRRDRFRRGRATAVLSVLLVFALAAAVVAFVQQRTAKEQRNMAISGKVANEATALRKINPALAAQLSLAAYRLAPTPEARGSLLSTFATPYSIRLTGHTGYVHEAAFSPDGRTLATASADHTARLWDVTDPHHPGELTTLVGHTSYVFSVAFSRDGRTLATGSGDHTVRLWDVTNTHHPRELATLTGHTGYVNAVAFSPGGQTLATGSDDRTARLWDVTDAHHPTTLATLTGHTDSLYSLAFSPDGHTLATASADNTARLWSVTDPHHPTTLATLAGYTDAVGAVAFSPDGHMLATGSGDRTARLWDVTDRHQPRELTNLTGHTDAVNAVAFSPDGRTLATASADNTARLWSVTDPHHPTTLATLTSHEGESVDTNAIAGVAFSRDGHTLVTSSYDHTVRLWDVSRPVLAGHNGAVRLLVFNSDAHTLVTVSADGIARLWDVTNLNDSTILATFTEHAHPVRTVAFSTDKRTLATISANNTARLWDITDWHQARELALLTLKGQTDAVYEMVFSPDGRTLATVNLRDRAATLWDITDRHRPGELATFALSGHTNSINKMVFSPDGRMLATTSFDHTARLWNVADPHHPRELAALTGHTNAVYGVVFSPDGRTLATTSLDQTARLWNVADPHHPHELATLTGHTNFVDGVAFSPDGRTLATASGDRTARLWDVTDPHHPHELATLTGHTGHVYAVAFSPDARTLATGSADNTVNLWETDVEHVAARICNIAHPPINHSEWNQYFPGLAYHPPCPLT